MKHQLTIEEVHPLTDTILTLSAKSSTPLVYEAGQYIEVKTPEGVLPLSIANAPLGGGKIELHIRHVRDNSLNQSLLNVIREEGKIEVSEAKGECTLTVLDKEKPILLIAGGTGFAPIKAMIEQLLYEGDNRQLHLFWLANKKADFYMDDKVSQWAKHMPQFSYTPLISSRHQKSFGVKAMIKTIYKDTPLSFQSVIAGPFDLVFALRDELVLLGLTQAHIYSDAFSFEGNA